MPKKFHILLIYLLAAELVDPVAELAADSKRIIKEVQSPIFSYSRGFHPGPLLLTINSPTPGAVIYYTTNGSEPSGFIEDRFLLPYDHFPIRIDSTTVVRARAFKSGHRPSRIVTQTFFIDESCTLPIVSLATDPLNLWDHYEGIYVSGKDRNFEKNWEKPAHLELYESVDSHGYALDIGLRIHGGWSRRLPQKSLAVFARKEYGSSKISYQLFPNKQVYSFKSFILRNSGNDWAHTLLRDAMMQTLVKDRMDIDFQDYRPVVVFLNGKYWGIHNLREKLNEHYIESNHGIARKKIDLLEGDGTVLEGDADQYSAMMEFLESSDMTTIEAYDHLESLLDVGEFINYQLSQIYFANTDWFDENIKYWRPREEGGRWRWMLFDTDYGFNLPLALTPSPPHHNTLKMAADSFLFGRLLDNPIFRNEFIQRFASHLNTTFHPDRAIHIIDSLKVQIAPEIPRHINRWKDSPAPYYGDPFSSIEEWENNVEELRSFARQRTDNIRRHILTEFKLETQVIVHLEGNPNAGGRVQINGVNIDSLPWSGVYFPNLPIQLTALAEPGRTFSGWSDLNLGNSPTAVISLTGNFRAEVQFEISALPNVVINEINYHSPQSSNPGDWVEIHNPGNEPIDMSGWHFLDMNNSHDFILPGNTVVGPNGYIVLCQDSTEFHRHFPELKTCIGDFEFGLSNGGELIMLYDSSGAMVDSLTYDDRHPWPVKPDGTGSTLALLASSGHNGTYRNWVSAKGTPGAANALYDSSDFRVDFSSPDILVDHEGIYLTWTTNLESQNQGFKIYRSINGDKFISVASYKNDGRLQGRLVGIGPLQYVWVDDDVDIGNKYSYLLSSTSMNGEEERYSDQILTTEFAVPEEWIPNRFLINFPNPFYLKTFLIFSFKEKLAISLTIYNVRGEKIRRFIEGDVLEEGEYTVEWKGRDDSGRPVSSGVYFARLKSSDFSITRKMLLVK